jgi:CHASE2 domain-containing sensor protein
MARPLLRTASVALAAGGLFGLIFGGVFMWQALGARNQPGMSGIVAGWAIFIWLVSAAVTGLAAWTWRTTFKKAAITLTCAGYVGLYWAGLYLGHDFTPWPTIALGIVSVLVLVPTAAAFVLHRREARARRRGER